MLADTLTTELGACYQRDFRNTWDMVMVRVDLYRTVLQCVVYRIVVELKASYLHNNPTGLSAAPQQDQRRSARHPGPGELYMV